MKKESEVGLGSYYKAIDLDIAVQSQSNCQSWTSHAISWTVSGSAGFSNVCNQCEAHCQVFNLISRNVFLIRLNFQKMKMNLKVLRWFWSNVLIQNAGFNQLVFVCSESVLIIFTILYLGSVLLEQKYDLKT